MAEQLTIGDLATSDAIRSAFNRDRKRRRRGERAVMAEEELGVQLRAHGVPVGVTQFAAAKHLGRKFSWDRAWPEYLLLLEVQGGVFRKGGGAHSHPLNILRDIEKQSYAALCGYCVLPVTTDQVRKGEALQWIVQVLESRGWNPTRCEREAK